MTNRPIFATTGEREHLSYSLHGAHACPSCARSNWLVGRLFAECAYCGDVLPINLSSRPIELRRTGRSLAA